MPYKSLYNFLDVEETYFCIIIRSFENILVNSFSIETMDT
jgi:hypothetical protein